jgi:hypothetical protein
MPIFDWKCDHCEHEWEELVKPDREPERCANDECPSNQPQAAVVPAPYPISIKKLHTYYPGRHVSWSKWRVLN